MQTACRIQHVPIACFITNLFLSVRYFSSVSFCSTAFFIHTANGFDAFDKTDMIFRNRNRKKSQFKMHETKGCPMKESTISDDDNFSTKKMVVQFFCLLSLSFKWIETMREHFFLCDLNKRKRLLIMIFILLCTLQRDKMTMKNDNEIYSIYTFTRNKNKRAKEKTKNV